MKYSEIELAIANLFGTRQYAIIPNLSYGIIGDREADLTLVKPSGYCIEVEIKVSKSDFKADFKKRHRKKDYNETFFRELYYAVPKDMEEFAMESLPSHAGLICFCKSEYDVRASFVKPPEVNKKAFKLTSDQYQKLFRLASMRIWNLKQKCNYLERNIQKFVSEIQP